VAAAPAVVCHSCLRPLGVGPRVRGGDDLANDCLASDDSPLPLKRLERLARAASGSVAGCAPARFRHGGLLPAGVRARAARTQRPVLSGC
jgi:hypothetical protein